jgi:hypothetical protein
VLQQEVANDNKKLYKANHLYLMKIALIEKKQQRNKTTSITRNGEDPPNQNQGDSSNFRS